MKKRIFILFLSLIMVIAFAAGCGSKEKPVNEDAGKRTVVDATGAKIEVPANPKHIVVSPVVLPNMIYFLTEKDDNQLAITQAAFKGYENSIMKDMAPDFAKKVNTTMINNEMQVNLEELAGSDADLVIYWDTQSEEAKKVNEMGIPAVCVTLAKDMDSLKSLITMLGDILNKKDRAAQLLKWYDDVETKVNKKAEKINALAPENKPRVLQLRNLQELSVYAKGVDAKLIETVGGTNVQLTGPAADSSKLTMEEVLSFDPEIILLSNWDDFTPQDLYDNKIPGQDWSGVSAVKHHKVYKVPKGLYRWTPPNCTEKPLYELYLASIIQPNIYNIKIEKEIKDFFKTFFKYDLSKKQMDKVMHRDMNEEKK